MCGIVAALPVYGSPEDGPSLVEMIAAIPEVPPSDGSTVSDPAALDELLEHLLEPTSALLDALGRESAAALLVSSSATRRRIVDACGALLRWAGSIDARLDDISDPLWDATTTEVVQGRLRALTDVLYGLINDRAEIADRAATLAPGPISPRAATSYLAVEAVLAALNRLEVRGRDSAGLTIWVHLDEADRAGRELGGRADPLFRSGAAVRNDTGVCFAYKRAVVVGRLGENVTSLRDSIRRDAAIHELVAMPSARVTVLAHTRWASVGRISEANAHPVDSRVRNGDPGLPFTVAALNGDVDNYLSLLGPGHAPDDGGITTDAKVIPMLLSQRLAAGAGPGEALGSCLRDFDGSMAIAVQPQSADGELVVGVKGSGQALYIGFGAGGFLVASEVYGLIGVTGNFLRVDGGSFPGAGRPGTVIGLARTGSGSLAGLTRWDGDGVIRPVAPQEIKVAQVTTRDLALGTAEHFLRKEIHEAPSSFRKTLRGRIHQGDFGPVAALPESSVPAQFRRRLRDGEIASIALIGQGTAAVACEGIAELIRSMVGDKVVVVAQPATEFSAWALRSDMSDTCVVAVSQSGTTTDTNRSVDLARERGATVLSIVNRRDSDLATKSDGVLYTSDGRDVEMAVASTKAFYAQVAAGCLLGVVVARELGVLSVERESSLLRALQQVPGRLLAVHQLEGRLATAAAEVVTRYPYWAVVGSGPNRVCASEVRIKLSELCYKTISTDAVEDKKHIDLSAEALVVVFVAGAPLNQISDLVKEVEILAAHGNHPIVICDEGTEAMWPAKTVIGLPAGHPDLAWLVAVAAGHLFAYHAAKCIDATANRPRTALARLEHAMDTGHDPSAELPVDVVTPIAEMLDAAGRGDLRGVLSSQAAIQLARVLLQPRHGLPTGVYAVESSEPIATARAALTSAIDELARSIDTVKHQAKTVTVGTSRDDADLYENDIVKALQAAGSDRHGFTLPSLRIIRTQARVIHTVTGVTRYRIGCGARGEVATIQVLKKTGVASHLVSRAERSVPLAGSKRRATELRLPRLVRGPSDGRIVLVVPEQNEGIVDHLAVVHVELRDRGPIEDLVAAMNSVGDRLAEIEAAVTELTPSFDLSALRALATETILLAPVGSIAEQLSRATSPESRLLGLRTG